jgi:hypothetical protein
MTSGPSPTPHCVARVHFHGHLMNGVAWQLAAPKDRRLLRLKE